MKNFTLFLILIFFVFTTSVEASKIKKVEKLIKVAGLMEEPSKGKSEATVSPFIKKMQKLQKEVLVDSLSKNLTEKELDYFMKVFGSKAGINFKKALSSARENFQKRHQMEMKKKK